MGRLRFLGVHEEGHFVRSVLLSARGSSRYRIDSLGSTVPSSKSRVPWGTALPSDALSIKVSSFSEEEDSWQERELETIEFRREPQGRGDSLRVISVSVQSKEVRDRISATKGGELPNRLDAEPLALWAARQVMDSDMEVPFFLLHALRGRWVVLFVKEGVLLHAGHFPRPEDESSPEEGKKIGEQLKRIARVHGPAGDPAVIRVELSGSGTEGFQEFGEGLKVAGWPVTRSLSPSRRFRRRFGGGKGFSMTHLVALGVALRGLAAAKGSPLINFSPTVSARPKIRWYASFRLTAALLIICAVAWAWLLSRSVREMDAHVRDLKKTLSQYATVLDPSAKVKPGRLEQVLSAKVASYREEVNRLGTARYPSVTAVDMLAALSTVFSDMRAFQLKEILLDGDFIHLSGTLGSLQRVTRFQESLRKVPGIRSVDLLFARSVKGRVEARFRLGGPPWHGR